MSVPRTESSGMKRKNKSGFDAEVFLESVGVS